MNYKNSELYPDEYTDHELFRDFMSTNFTNFKTHVYDSKLILDAIQKLKEFLITGFPQDPIIDSIIPPFYHKNTKFTSPSVTLENMKYIFDGIFPKKNAYTIGQLKYYKFYIDYVNNPSNYSKVGELIPLTFSNTCKGLGLFSRGIQSNMQSIQKVQSSPVKLAVEGQINKPPFISHNASQNNHSSSFHNQTNAKKEMEQKVIRDNISKEGTTSATLTTQKYTFIVIEPKINRKEELTRTFKLYPKKRIYIQGSPKLTEVEKSSERYKKYYDESTENLQLKDESLDVPQITLEGIEGQSHDYKLGLQCNSGKFLSLVKLPTKGVQWMLFEKDYYIISDTEGVLVNKSVCKDREREKIIYAITNHNLFSPRFVDDWGRYVHNENANTKDEVENMLEIQLILGERLGELIEIRESDSPYTIGRDRSCNLVLNDPGISLRHATIELIPNVGWTISESNKHKQSLNGTWLSLNIFENKRLQRPSPIFPMKLDQKIVAKASSTELNIKLILGKQIYILYIQAYSL